MLGWTKTARPSSSRQLRGPSQAVLVFGIFVYQRFARDRDQKLLSFLVQLALRRAGKSEALRVLLHCRALNEPQAAQIWESCIYTAEEESDFVRDHFGPALEAADPSRVKIIIWDHNRDGMQSCSGDRRAQSFITPRVLGQGRGRGHRGQDLRQGRHARWGFTGLDVLRGTWSPFKTVLNAKQAS
ncbi:unnamed protein product [Symbiodinium sp. CCMP2456]|nr:unnamed protein product [Symbiodinium sp. CCMP2456]